MNARSSGQQGMTQSAINAYVNARLEHLEKNHEKILLVLRGQADEANGKDSIIGRLHRLEIEQIEIAKELSKHLDFHKQMAERVEKEQRERKEFQQRLFLTLFVFLLSNIGMVLLSLRYFAQLLTQ